MSKNKIKYFLITLASALYGVATAVFIFPHSVLIGGTSGISVILSSFSTVFPLSPGTILMIINFSLVVLSFFALGSELGIMTLLGSTLTAFFIGVFEKLFINLPPVTHNLLLSSVTGASLIAVASGVMFFLDANSGGTDIIAMIIKKHLKVNVGRALLVTDALIVICGGILGGYYMAICSFLGLLIKTLGIDFVIYIIKKLKGDK